MEPVRLGEKKAGGEMIKFQNAIAHVHHILSYFPITWELFKKPEQHKKLVKLYSFNTFLISLIGTFACQRCCK